VTHNLARMGQADVVKEKGAAIEQQQIAPARPGQGRQGGESPSEAWVGNVYTEHTEKQHRGVWSFDGSFYPDAQITCSLTNMHA